MAFLIRSHGKSSLCSKHLFSLLKQHRVFFLGFDKCNSAPAHIHLQHFWKDDFSPLSLWPHQLPSLSSLASFCPPFMFHQRKSISIFWAFPCLSQPCHLSFCPEQQAVTSPQALTSTFSIHSLQKHNSSFILSASVSFIAGNTLWTSPKLLSAPQLPAQRKKKRVWIT